MTRKQESSSHAHYSSTLLTEAQNDVLRRGLKELVRMTEGMEFRALPSQKYPLPLASAAYKTAPDGAAARGEVLTRMADDPLGALEGALALVELYESNQGDVRQYFLEDMPFIRECFASKRCNGWICVMGDGDAGAIQEAVNRQWQFKFFSGPRRPTGVYYVLNMLSRYAFVYGRIGFGDSHEVGHFVEEYCPGLVICSGRLTDLELTLSLAAMKMGVPAIVHPDYPFTVGRMLRAGTVEEIAGAVMGFGNIRRLLRMPDVPPMPDYCSPENLGQEFAPVAVWGDTAESFFHVRKGKAARSEMTVRGRPEGPLGILVTIDAEPMDAFDREYIESKIAESPSLIKGVKASYDGRKLRISLAEGARIEARQLGEVLLAATRHEFPKLSRVRVEVILDGRELAALSNSVEQEKKEREAEIAAATEENVREFVACVGCSPFAPDHVCIVTPERPPQCGRQYGYLKTGALYGYDDMTNIHHRALHQDINSFGLVAKGKCLDPAMGEWEGVNKRAGKLTGGRTTRIQLHSLDEYPTTGCGCFSLIMYRAALPRPGIAIMDAGYKGQGPDGRTWKDLHYALAGKQTAGMAGASAGYLFSRKFLAAHRGWKSVVWVSPKIASIMEGKLPAGVEVGRPD